MDKSEFKRFLETKKKLTKEFKNVDELEEKYNKVIKNREKMNEYQKTYHKDMMENDPDYVEKRKEYNKQSYLRYKELHPRQKKDKQDKPSDNVARGIVNPASDNVARGIVNPASDNVARGIVNPAIDNVACGIANPAIDKPIEAKKTLDSFFNNLIGF